MDGNFLWYASDDCSKKCKCDDTGKISCEIPSDCGPQNDVVEYCASNPSFTCTCLTSRGDTRALRGKQYGNTKVSRSVEEIEETESGLASVIMSTLEGNAGNESEQSETVGIPILPSCWLNWSCWRYRTTRTHAEQLATTLITSTTKQASQTLTL